MAQPMPAFEPNAHAVDKGVIRELRSLDEPGEDIFFSGLVREFSAEGVRLLARVHQTAEAGDATGLRNFAHSLKDSSGSMGATGLAELCGRLEGFGRRNNMSSARLLLPFLQKEWGRVMDALQGYLNE
jgi:HPt (histidine-containing phosphotransfer) domain-containing protein